MRGRLELLHEESSAADDGTSWDPDGGNSSSDDEVVIISDNHCDQEEGRNADDCYAHRGSTASLDSELESGAAASYFHERSGSNFQELQYRRVSETIQLAMDTGQRKPLNSDLIATQFQTLYDIPNDLKDEVPYRALQYWYLVDTRTEHPDLNVLGEEANNRRQGRRRELPTRQGTFEPGLVLRGWLESRSEAVVDPIFIEISNPLELQLDFSKQLRGWWVKTESALYWLHRPCDRRDTVDGKSQEELYLSARAQLGVLSNLLDSLFTTETAQYYAPLSLDEAHAEAQRRTGQEEPFDRKLLAFYAPVIYAHLVEFQPCLTRQCKFLKSLYRCFPEAERLFHKKKKNKKRKQPFDAAAPPEPDDFEIILSTLHAETRSMQYRWGRPANATPNNAEIVEQQQMTAEGDAGVDSAAVPPPVSFECTDKSGSALDLAIQTNDASGPIFLPAEDMQIEVPPSTERERPTQIIRIEKVQTISSVARSLWAAPPPAEENYEEIDSSMGAANNNDDLILPLNSAATGTTATTTAAVTTQETSIRLDEPPSRPPILDLSRTSILEGPSRSAILDASSIFDPSPATLSLDKALNKAKEVATAAPPPPADDDDDDSVQVIETRPAPGTTQDTVASVVSNTSSSAPQDEDDDEDYCIEVPPPPMHARRRLRDTGGAVSVVSNSTSGSSEEEVVVGPSLLEPNPVVNLMESRASAERRMQALNLMRPPPQKRARFPVAALDDPAPDEFSLFNDPTTAPHESKFSVASSSSAPQDDATKYSQWKDLLEPAPLSNFTPQLLPGAQPKENDDDAFPRRISVEAGKNFAAMKHRQLEKKQRVHQQSLLGTVASNAIQPGAQRQLADFLSVGNC